MVIHTGVSAALYCPVCGSVSVMSLNCFMPVTASWQELQCDCGEPVGYVRHSRNGIWLMRIPCVLCGQTHLVILDTQRLGREAPMERICCETYGVELGFYGADAIVQYIIRRQQWECIHLLGESECYSNPGILLAAYNRVHDMIAERKITCCCGEPDLFVQLLSASLIVQCRHCGRTFQIAAVNERDVSSLSRNHSIVLTTIGMPG